MRKLDSYPQFLFRHLRGQYALELVEHGKIQIKPFTQYRTDASAQRGDAGEGTLTYTGHIANASYARYEDVPLALRIAFPCGHNSRFSNCVITGLPVTAPTRLILSLSETSDGASVNREYDACVKIRKPYRFAQCLGAALADRCGARFDSQLGRCIYQSRDVHPLTPDEDPIWFKPVDQQAQREWRIVFIPAKGDWQPPASVDLVVPEVMEFCELLEASR